MASHAFNAGLAFKEEFGLSPTTDLRLILCMSDQSAGSENDGIAFIDDMATLDECDGANYVRKPLAGEVVTVDDANDRAAFDANDLSWTALGNGTRELAGILSYFHVNDDTDSVPFYWHEFGSPINPGGTNLIVAWNANGIYLLSEA